jgi:hypothetical protein
MSEIAGSENPKCWSFAQSGQRCDLLAGHMAPHQHALNPLVEVAAAPDLDPDVQVIGAGRCINCDHREHVEPCERLIGPRGSDIVCGCTLKRI